MHNNSAIVASWPDCGGIFNEADGQVYNCIIACNYGNSYAALHSEGIASNNICWNNKAKATPAEGLAFIGDTHGSECFTNAAVSGNPRAITAMQLNADNYADNGPNFKMPVNFTGIPESDADIKAMRAADWSFAPNSPCINIGTPINGFNYDIIGTQRPQDSNWDLGAYEYLLGQTAVLPVGIELVSDTVTIIKGEQAWLAVAFSPQNTTNKSVIWSIENQNIATVSNKGLVSAAKIGNTWAFAKSGANNLLIDSCVINIVKKTDVFVHADVKAADTLSVDDYAIPSFTHMLVAKEAARADSSEANLQNLKTAIENLLDKNTPYCMVATINGDPKSQMAFTWFTNTCVTQGSVQIVEKQNADTTDFASAINFDANYKLVKNIPYVVDGTPIQEKTGLTNDSTRSYNSHKVMATGLKPNTNYSYRVGKTGHWSNIGSFKTDDNNLSEFKFLYMTDAHLFDDLDGEYIPATRLAAQVAAKQAPDARFLLFTGDMVENGTSYNGEWEWEQFFDNSMRPLIQNLPMVPTDGNHDDSENLNYTYHFNTDNSFNSVVTVKPQFDGITYSFVYGDALFLLYSHQDYWRAPYSYTDKTSEYLTEVANWMKQEVKKHPNTKWRIAAVHKNLFTGSGHQNDEESAMFREIMLPVMDQLKIDFVIQGHDHVYEVMGPVNNLTKTIIDTNIISVDTVDINTNNNMSGRSGGVFDVSGSTMYFVNGTCGRKRYYPYSRTEMDKYLNVHQVQNYFDLFTGRFGQPEAPTFSQITVNTDTITIETFMANPDTTATLFDSFKIVRKQGNSISDNPQKIEIENKLSQVYPMPATNFVNIPCKNVKSVTAFDTLGRPSALSFDNQSVDISELNNGLYILHVKTLNGKYVYKIIKKAN